ncbi:MAG: cytochrome c [Pseudomonadota bacterium]|nr:cytochrome c [Pseudomonadota bacterium]
MKNATKTSLVTAVTLAAFAIGGGAVFVGSGIYDIGADDHHTELTLAMIEQLRERSIKARIRGLEIHTISDPARIAAGAQRYAALCVGCHLAPGVAKSDIRPGLYPHPPSLAQGKMQAEQRAFWIIKHGIKMSAMPAWGKSLDDDAIWDLVAFVRKLPEMTPETYAQIARVQ